MSKKQVDFSTCFFCAVKYNSTIKQHYCLLTTLVQAAITTMAEHAERTSLHT